MRRPHPLVLGTVAAVVALAAAIGAGALVRAVGDDGGPPEPEVSLSLDGDDDESGDDDLIGGEVAGDEAPGVTYALLAGGTGSLEDHRGTPVVLNFFASWCVPCVTEMPAFEAVHQELGDRVHFIGLDVRDSVRAATDLVEKTGVTYETGRDPSGEIFESFEAVSMPSTFLISAGGVVVKAHAGALDEDELRDLIIEHLLTS